MKEETVNDRKVTMTVSCPLSLFAWLKDTQRNISAFVIKAIEAAKKATVENAKQGGEQ
jgi:hypothetical protein